MATTVKARTNRTKRAGAKRRAEQRRARERWSTAYHMENNRITEMLISAAMSSPAPKMSTRENPDGSFTHIFDFTEKEGPDDGGDTGTAGAEGDGD